MRVDFCKVSGRYYIKCVTFPCNLKGFWFNSNSFYQIKVFKTTLYSVKYFTCQFPPLRVCCAQGLSIRTVRSSGPAQLYLLSEWSFLLSPLLSSSAPPVSPQCSRNNPPKIQILGSVMSCGSPLPAEWSLCHLP